MHKVLAPRSPLLLLLPQHMLRRMMGRMRRVTCCCRAVLPAVVVCRPVCACAYRQGGAGARLRWQCVAQRLMNDKDGAVAVRQMTSTLMFEWLDVLYGVQ